MSRPAHTLPARALCATHPLAPVCLLQVKTHVDIKLKAFDAKNKIKVIKEIRGVTSLGLKEVRASRPSPPPPGRVAAAAMAAAAAAAVLLLLPGGIEGFGISRLWAGCCTLAARASFWSLC